ncbi:transcriptional regulator [Peptoniphilus porci]|uniref:transcriptional regulator n=1 Tax=Peptoniphilus porci TaxID=2652280 RepID=UPI001F421E0C|nr:transcriptional regulator [Peptoniphilus porci]
MERLETEVNACKRYAENSVKKVKKGKVGSAINFLDIAVTAKKCADRLHDEFWEVSDGKLTEEEFNIFCEAETLNQDITKFILS